MKEKIKNNFNLIILVATIVAMLLVLPNIFNSINRQINNDMIMTIINWAGFYTACALLVYGSIKNNYNNLLFYIMAFMLLGGIVNNAYGITQGSYLDIYYLALDAALFILFIIRQLKPNKFVNIAFYIIFLTYAALTVVPVLGGGTTQFAYAILVVSVFTIVLKKDLEEDKKEESDNE